MGEVIQDNAYSQFYSVVIGERIYTFGGMDGDSIDCEVDDTCMFNNTLDKVFYTSIDMSIANHWYLHGESYPR